MATTQVNTLPKDPNSMNLHPLDNDLYKFLMGQAVFHQFPDVQVEYKFYDRGNILPKDYAHPFWSLVFSEFENYIANLKFDNPSIEYLRSLGFKEDYLKYIQLLQLKSYDIFSQGKCFVNKQIIFSNKWSDAILFEVPFLAIISELYYKYFYNTTDEEDLV